MVLVDSTVWIEALTSQEPEAWPTRIGLDALLAVDAVVFCDVVNWGIASRISVRDYDRVAPHLAALPFYPCEYGDWAVAGQLARDTPQLHLEDALVAAISLGLQCRVFSMSPIFSNLPVHRYEPGEGGRFIPQ